MTRRKFIANTTATALGAAAVQAGTKSARAAQMQSAKPQSKGGKRKVTAAAAPKPAGPYSHAIVAGDMIYVAGQGPFNPETGKLVGPGIAEQTEQTLKNIKTILEAAGAGLSDVVKVSVYLADLGDFAKMNEVYSRVFPEPFPARATIGAKLLLEMRIEVECVAYKPAAQSKR